MKYLNIIKNYVKFNAWHIAKRRSILCDYTGSSASNNVYCNKHPVANCRGNSKNIYVGIN